MDLDRSMKNLIQSENDFFQSVNRLEAQMSRLINIVKDKNEKALPNTFFIILDCPNYIDRKEESWCLGDIDQDSISPQNLEFDQYQPIANWHAFISMKLNLNMNVTPTHNFVI